jgi:hypothetical protein
MLQSRHFVSWVLLTILVAWSKDLKVWESSCIKGRLGMGPKVGHENYKAFEFLMSLYECTFTNGAKRVESTLQSFLVYQKSRSRKRMSKRVVYFSRELSVAGTRTRVARVRAEYPNHLDYNGGDEIHL